MIALSASETLTATQLSHEPSQTLSVTSNGDDESVSLSRNTSVISTTSSSSSSSSSIAPPQRPRPIRTYTGPQAKNVPDVIPASPTTPKATQRTFDDYLAVSPSSSSRASPAPNISAQMATAIARGVNGLSIPGSFPLGQSSSGTSTPVTRTQTPTNGTPNGARSRQPSASNNVQNYRFDGMLGEGSYSTVFVATSLVNQQVYAVKVISKRLLQKENKVRYATSERAILSKLGSANHPGIIKLFSAFQDANSLYFALELAPNGELFTQIRKLGSFDITGTQYYAATILDAVAFIHSMNIIHRDLKPENILLDANMRIKISDFGSAKDKSIAVVINSNDAKATKGSFVGTPEYASPEMLVPPTITTRASDIWAYGCVVFQFIAGRPPFKEATDYLTMKKIQEGIFSFPDGFDPVVKTLVERSLVTNPTIRITSQELREHAFFESVDWDTIWKQDPPKLECGLVKPPPKSHEDDNIHINLTWTMDGSEDEMEDLRPPQDYHHQQVSSIPIPSSREIGQASDAKGRRDSLEMTPTRERDDSRMAFKVSSSPTDVKAALRHFANDINPPLITPLDPGSAIMFTPASEHPGKARRPSSSSDIPPRPRRMSPASGTGRPTSRPRPYSQGFIEGDESSEQWSAESPPSPSEHLVESGLEPIDEARSGKGVTTGVSEPGVQSLISAGKSGSTQSNSTDLMSTSGTSKGSTTSGNMSTATKGFRGFERIRGMKGVELGESSQSISSAEGWLRRDGLPLLNGSETSVLFTPVTTRVKRGLLPPRQRRRLLMLTSSGRLLCLKEIKSTTGKKKAQIEDEVLMRLVSPITSPIPEDTATPPANGSSEPPKASAPVDVPVTPDSSSSSKRTSIIGLTFGSGNSFSSAIPGLNLGGSSKGLSSASLSVGSPPSGTSSTALASRLIAVVTRVENRGETGFMVYLGEKSLVFGVDSATMANKWVDHLKKAMEV